MMLKDAPIIVLDEATASIDPENEHLIQHALSERNRGKAVITIARRLAAIESADQILVPEDGLYRRFLEARQQAESWTIAL